MKKLIDARMKYLLSERDAIVEDATYEGAEMRMMQAMVSLRILMELKFLAELLSEIGDKPTDAAIEAFFPVFAKYTEKEKEVIEIKRKAVKSFIKNKL